MAKDLVFSPTFVIGLIRIGQIEGASCLNMGNNWPSNFRSFKKHNQGFGSVHGDGNEVRGARSLLNDPDTLDMLTTYDSDIPDWVRSLTKQPTGGDVHESDTSSRPSTADR